MVNQSWYNACLLAYTYYIYIIYTSYANCAALLVLVLRQLYLGTPSRAIIHYTSYTIYTGISIRSNLYSFVHAKDMSIELIITLHVDYYRSTYHWGDSICCRSRKRRTSNSHDDFKEDQMNECTAALVLMSLSCSPNSSLNGEYNLILFQNFPSDEFSVERVPRTSSCVERDIFVQYSWRMSARGVL